MTIDEAIVDCKENDLYQIAEWLEELKELRKLKAGHLYAVAFNRGYLKAENDYHAQSEKDRQSSYDCGYELGYSKAIDDFTVIFKSKTSMENKLVDEIAEELKAGGENEDSKRIM